MNIHTAIETKSAANVIKRCADTIQTMITIGSLVESDRERMDTLVSMLYGEAINLNNSAELQLQS